MKKIFVVYARQRDEGPWKPIAAYTSKVEANHRAQAERLFWDATRVIAEFPYQAKAKGLL